MRSECCWERKGTWTWSEASPASASGARYTGGVCVVLRYSLALRVVIKVQDNRQWGIYCGAEIMGKGGDRLVILGVYKVVSGRSGSSGNKYSYGIRSWREWWKVV